jgi:hypothetical protein
MSVPSLRSELALYGDTQRKSSGVTDGPGLVSGMSFRVSRPLFSNDLMGDEQIELGAERIAETAVSVFDELSFLYELLLPPGEELRSREDKGPASPPQTTVPANSPASEEQLDEEEDSNLGPFDAESLSDERTRVFANVVQRQGQSTFRDSLLKAYSGKCTVTGYGVVDVLQAANIKPYTGEKSNHVTNGLLLRADIHNLFDLHLLSIDPKTNKIEVSPSLMGSEYAKFHGLRICIPNDRSKQPDPTALTYHYNLRRRK